MLFCFVAAILACSWLGNFWPVAFIRHYHQCRRDRRLLHSLHRNRTQFASGRTMAQINGKLASELDLAFSVMLPARFLVPHSA